MAANASNTGIGACIFHRFEDGTVKAVYHVSRTLTDTEKRYSQIEKDGLALIFSVTKFHRMIFGQHFTLQTDQMPLLKNQVKVFRVTLQIGYKDGLYIILKASVFNIEYVNTSSFFYADVLSRLINNHSKPDDVIIATITTENDMRQIIHECFD